MQVNRFFAEIQNREDDLATELTEISEKDFGDNSEPEL